MLKTHKGILQRVKREKNLRKSLGKGKISVSQIKMRKKAKKKICFFDYKKPKKGKGTPIKSSEGKKIEQTPRMVREVREERERKHTQLYTTLQESFSLGMKKLQKGSLFYYFSMGSNYFT